MTDISLMTLGVSSTEIAHKINELEEYEDLVSVGIDARSYHDQTQWILGCLARRITTKYGEQTIAKYAKEIGVRVATLEGYRWTVDRYLSSQKDFVPPENVPFSVLKAVAGLEPAGRDILLQQAQEHSLSTENIRIMVQKEKGKLIKPKFQVEYCKEHGKWHFIPQNLNEWEGYHD